MPRASQVEYANLISRCLRRSAFLAPTLALAIIPFVAGCSTKFDAGLEYDQAQQTQYVAQLRNAGLKALSAGDAEWAVALFEESILASGILPDKCPLGQARHDVGAFLSKSDADVLARRYYIDAVRSYQECYGSDDYVMGSAAPTYEYRFFIEQRLTALNGILVNAALAGVRIDKSILEADRQRYSQLQVALGSN